MLTQKDYFMRYIEMIGEYLMRLANGQHDAELDDDIAEALHVVLVGDGLALLLAAQAQLYWRAEEGVGHGLALADAELPGELGAAHDEAPAVG